MVSEFGRPVRFAELVGLDRFPKGTLYRFVQTLAKERMLQYDPDGKYYSIGPRLLELAHSGWRQYSLASIAKPHIDQLSESIEEVVYLSTLDGGHALSLSRSSPDLPTDAFAAVGRVFPAYCTGVGKAMLAGLTTNELDAAIAQQTFERLTDETIVDEDRLLEDLRTTRERGYALELREHVRGVISVAVPIQSRSGRVFGGLGIHAPQRRTDLDALIECTPQMQKTARHIAAAVEIWSPPQQGQYSH